MADPSYITDNVLTDGEAWIALASTTLGSATTSITFTDPSDGSSLDWCQFMDIVAICYWKGTQTGAGYEFGYCYINGDSTAGNYMAQHIYGDGATVFATAGTPLAIAFGTVKEVDDPTTPSANIFGGTVCTFSDVNSGKWKTSVSQQASDIAVRHGPYPFVGLTVRTWKSQAAISSLVFRMENGDLQTASRIDLFGVLPRMGA